MKKDRPVKKYPVECHIGCFSAKRTVLWIICKNIEYIITRNAKDPGGFGAECITPEKFTETMP